MVVDDREKLQNVLKMRRKTPKLKHIVLVEKPKAEGEEKKLVKGRAKAETDLEVHFWEDLIEPEEDKENRDGDQLEDHPPKPEDIYMIWSVDLAKQ